MAAHARLKNEFTEDEKYHNQAYDMAHFMMWRIILFSVTKKASRLKRFHKKW